MRTTKSQSDTFMEKELRECCATLKRTREYLKLQDIKPKILHDIRGAELLLKSLKHYRHGMRKGQE